MTAHQANRGPAASADNRAAILAAGKVVFAREGYRVSLRAIAAEAQVSQAVFYRHFPTRLDLALAVFDESLDAFAEHVSAMDAQVPGTFATAWALLEDLVVENVAFVETAVEAGRELENYNGAERLRGILESALDAARQRSEVPPGIGISELALVLRAMHGVVKTASDAQVARQDVSRLSGLLRLGQA